MERTRTVRRPYLSARIPQMEDDSSIPRNTTVVSVACWYSAREEGRGRVGLGARNRTNLVIINDQQVCMFTSANGF